MSEGLRSQFRVHWVPILLILLVFSVAKAETDEYPSGTAIGDMIDFADSLVGTAQGRHSPGHAVDAICRAGDTAALGRLYRTLVQPCEDDYVRLWLIRYLGHAARFRQDLGFSPADSLLRTMLSDPGAGPEEKLWAYQGLAELLRSAPALNDAESIALADALLRGESPGSVSSALSLLSSAASSAPDRTDREVAQVHLNDALEQLSLGTLEFESAWNAEDQDIAKFYSLAASLAGEEELSRSIEATVARMELLHRMGEDCISTAESLFLTLWRHAASLTAEQIARVRLVLISGLNPGRIPEAQAEALADMASVVPDLVTEDVTSLFLSSLVICPKDLLKKPPQRDRYYCYGGVDDALAVFAAYAPRPETGGRIVSRIAAALSDGVPLEWGRVELFEALNVVLWHRPELIDSLPLGVLRDALSSLHRDYGDRAGLEACAIWATLARTRPERMEGGDVDNLLYYQAMAGNACSKLGRVEAALVEIAVCAPAHRDRVLEHFRAVLREDPDEQCRGKHEQADWVVKRVENRLAQGDGGQVPAPTRR